MVPFDSPGTLADVQAQKISFHAVWLSILVALIPLRSTAQNVYQLKFTGVESSLDSTGQSVDLKVTEKALIQEWAKKAGVSNTANLVLAFHLNASLSGGDAIEVVDKKQGTLIVTVFPLAFEESMAQVSSHGSTEKRFAYVYNIYEPGFSIGTALIDERLTLKGGQTNRVVLDGQMQWYQLLPNGTNGMRISSGKFVAGKRLPSH